MVTKTINHLFLHFGPVLCGTKTDLNLCKELLERGNKTTESNVSQLAGHIEHENNYPVDDMLWFVEKFKDYFIPYFKKLQSSADKTYWYGTKKFNRVFLQKLWINYMKKNEFNPPHTHGGAYSFVLYLQVPKAIYTEAGQYLTIGTDGKPISKGGISTVGPGEVLFFSGEDNRDLITAHGIQPKEGDLWIFPASLKHMVPPFKVDGTRVSVSGNIYVTDQLNKGQPIQPGEWSW